MKLSNLFEVLPIFNCGFALVMEEECPGYDIRLWTRRICVQILPLLMTHVNFG